MKRGPFTPNEVSDDDDGDGEILESAGFIRLRSVNQKNTGSSENPLDRKKMACSGCQKKSWVQGKSTRF